MEAISDTKIVVEGKVIYLTEFTEIDNDIDVGDRIEIVVDTLPDGSLLAKEIDLISDVDDGDDDGDDDDDD